MPRGNCQVPVHSSRQSLYKSTTGNMTRVIVGRTEGGVEVCGEGKVAGKGGVSCLFVWILSYAEHDS